MPDFLVFYKKDSHDMAVVEFLIQWIRLNADEEQQFWIQVIYHAKDTNRLIVARGPLTAKAQTVKLR